MKSSRGQTPRRSTTERLIDEIRKLKDRPDTKRVIEKIRKLNKQ